MEISAILFFTALLLGLTLRTDRHPTEGCRQEWKAACWSGNTPAAVQSPVSEPDGIEFHFHVLSITAE